MVFEFELRCPITADLGLIRDLVRLHGRHSGLPDRRLEDLVLAVNEAVTNVLDHGGKSGIVTARAAGGQVVVDVLDFAGLLTHDHLAAARLDRTASHGYGLWLIQHLCDEVVLELVERGSLLSLCVRDRSPAKGSPAKGSPANGSPANGRAANGSRRLQTSSS
ncbi:anti-sigma regulatory factor (Ser/Thr protein kinase) [Nonomuraea thailandensis]|uniref:Anti-sigma regulatory factor (Ser/Thr protein kinase) n=1 Tax=Nonomuraea thailandensis TaxID=1188745 RepID=A0A9X2GGF9_9ACTN|nr:ATP-binding protein [Nonomuraea thailandensis]MCP2358649.1 anti-sigma regulatory factor (Ser/Thr protein kinase) [Nonomuraea thailandensis]